MADSEENRKVTEISEFIRNSCRIRPSYYCSFANFFHAVSYPITRPDGHECKLFPVSTGSVAEFYIEPMLSSIGDTDVMYHYSNELATPKWHPPPMQLPADFENRVKVYEIVDSHLPGYVYLNLAYIISRDMTKDMYIIAEYFCSPNALLNNELHLLSECDVENHGPANMFIGKSLPNFLRQPGFMIDTVPCIHCFVWPPQAADWPKRHRNHAQPDSATVDCVVSEGCDLVGVAHRHCREDEWMRKHQWRVSFSRAEVVLLNSWMLQQQIVYHMLRVFAKVERLTGNTNCTADTLSNYHIKTMMLWACELKSQHWWNDGSTLVRKCLHLLWFLEKWLTTMHGQHYFINSLHFCDYIDKSYIEKISAMVKSSTESSLAKRFVDGYIRKCAKLCPDPVSISCSSLLTSEISPEILSAIMQWRDHVCSKTLVDHTVSFIIFCHLSHLSCFKTASPECQSIVQDQPLFPIAISLPQVDEQALLCFWHMLMTNLYLFKSHYRTLIKDIIADIIYHSCSTADERCKLQCFSLKPSALHRVSHFRKATVLMELAANKHCNTPKLLLIELSKLSLQTALQCNNANHDSYQCRALVHLSVLHYTTGQCQMAINHLTLVTKLKVHSQCCKHSSHVLEGKLLPKIDGNIDCALGLVVFYQYILTALFNKQETEPVGIFTLELFAHYFTAKHLLVAKCHCAPEARDEETTKTVEYYLCEELKSCFSTIVSSKHLFTSDFMLCKLSSNSCYHIRTVILTPKSTLGSSTRQIVNLMMELSLQQLLTYRHVMPPKDTVHVKESNTSDFMALYLYRCQLYEQCEQLCRQRICDLISADSCNVSCMSIVYHEFIELMDDDVVSAIGLTLLLNKTGHWYWSRGYFTVTQLTLSLCLLTKCLFTHTSVDLGTLAVILDWIASALKTIPAGEYVEYLMLKLTERSIVKYITWKLSGSVVHYAGECEVGIAFDDLCGLQLDYAHLSTNDVI